MNSKKSIQNFVFWILFLFKNYIKLKKLYYILQIENILIKFNFFWSFAYFFFLFLCYNLVCVNKICVYLQFYYNNKVLKGRSV